MRHRDGSCRRLYGGPAFYPGYEFSRTLPNRACTCGFLPLRPSGSSWGNRLQRGFQEGRFIRRWNYRIHELSQHSHYRISAWKIRRHLWLASDFPPYDRRRPYRHYNHCSPLEPQDCSQLTLGTSAFCSNSRDRVPTIIRVIQSSRYGKRNIRKKPAQLRRLSLCLGRELNPHGHFCPRDFKSLVSTFPPPRRGCKYTENFMYFCIL